MSRAAALRPSRPLTRHEWTALGLFSIVALIQGWSGTVITHVLPFVQDDFAMSDAAIFDLMTVIRVVSLGALALSWWGDHRGRRRPLLIACAVVPLANLAAAAVADPAGIAATQAIARIGSVALGSLALVVLAEEVGDAVRGYAIGVYALVAATATGLGLLLRPLGEDGDGWRVLFALSALPLLALPVLARRLRESRAFVPPPRRPPVLTVLRGGHARRFWPLAGLAFAISAFTSPAANLALVRLEQDLGWTAGGASLLLAVSAGPGVLLGVLVGGRLADTLGRRPTEAIAIAIGVSGGVAFYLLDIGWIIGLGLFVSNVGAFAFAPAFVAHRAELFPTGVRATAGAWIVNASILGGIAGFAAGRFVVDAWGIPATIVALGAVLVASSALILPLPETRGVTLEDGAAPDPAAAMPG